ncbi:MAG: hypothetical protein C5B43_03075 [Verrucomicrobia bacterium]|nr:MAG: hypothetical protein C5B43_03075 [Verrucomicrobiota bacterium]
MKKICKFCNREYVGEGEKGHCSERCYFVHHPNALERNKYVCPQCNIEFVTTKKDKIYCCVKCERMSQGQSDSIKRANERWLKKEDKPKIPKAISGQDGIMRSHLAKDPAWMKRFKRVMT